MRKTVLKLSAYCLFLIGLTACSSTPEVYTNPLPNVETSAKFRVGDVSLNVEQFVVPDIVYHTAPELQALVSEGVKKSLSQMGLLSNDPSMNVVDVFVTYKRRFIGDKTPLPSDSLSSPTFDYVLKIKDGDKRVSAVSKTNVKYSGSFSMNVKIAGGLLREKSDEIPFVNALVDSISKTVQSLRN